MEAKITYDDHTGLLYVDGVAFTKQAINRIKSMLNYNKKNNQQFIYAVVIEDTINNAVTAVDDDVMNEMEAYVAVHSLVLARDEDFDGD